MFARRSQLLFVALLALWQAVALSICLPASAAAPKPAEPSCCEHRTPKRDAEPSSTCPHCTDGRGQFAEPAQRSVAATPFAVAAIVESTPTLAPIASLAVARPSFDPLWPDPPPETLVRLSVEQLR